MKFILTVIFSFVFLVSGFSQTRNVVVGTNDVIVQPTNFWSANASNGRTGLGLGSAATNSASAFQPSSAVLSNLASSNAVNLTNLNASNITGVIPSSNIPTVSLTNIGGILAIASGGTGATNAAVARTNLGLDWSALTNTNAATSLLGFTTNGHVVYDNTNTLRFNNIVSFDGGPLINSSGIFWNDSGGGLNLENGFINNLNGITVITWADSNVVSFGQAIEFSNTTNAAATRTNLGLGWSALTNTNTSGFNASLYGSNTNPVLVNSNGNVVSPTNFWEVAPIQTLVQDFTGVTVSQTNNATNARNVYVYSLATNVSGISNTIILPTNTSTFNGDEVCVIHKGTTNTTTVVRQAGSTNNLITLNRFDESVKFIRELGQWDFYHNISFVEPIQFSGTNESVNAAASRTNLGIPFAALTNTNNSTFQQAIFTTNAAPTNAGTFGDRVAWMGVSIVTNGVTNTFLIPLYK